MGSISRRSRYTMSLLLWLVAAVQLCACYFLAQEMCLVSSGLSLITPKETDYFSCNALLNATHKLQIRGLGTQIYPTNLAQPSSTINE